LLLESDDDFDPRSEDNSTVANNNARNGTTPAPLLSPPPLQPRTTAINGIKDIFGAEPFGKNLTADPFGMDDFGRLASPPADSEFHTTTLGLLDRRITEMREGFSRGISFGGDDFNLESLDPLRS